MSDLSAEELEVGRRNLLSQLKAESVGNPKGSWLDAGTVRDLVEVLEGIAACLGDGVCANPRCSRHGIEWTFDGAPSLRDALEKLVDEWDALPCVSGYKIPNGNDDDSQCLSCAALDLRTLLAAHPAEPVGVSDEAVEAAHGNDCPLCRGLGGIAVHVRWSEQRGKPLWTAHEYPSDDPHPTLPCPFMQPQVVASRERTTEVLHRERHFGRKCDQVDPRECLHYREAWRDVDVLLAAGVFREPPTREQIAVAIDPEAFDAREYEWIHWDGRRTKARAQADAVLALMGGADE